MDTDTRHSDNDGSDIFWPGYVDATTNLILNLLFLVTILIVAVFMFALELGRTSKDGATQTQVVATIEDADDISKATTDPIKENIALKREIQRLKKMLAQGGPQKEESGGLFKSVDATSKVPEPLKGLDETLIGGFEIIVRFKDEAVALTPSEHDQLLDDLKPVLESKGTRIYVEVPAGFSEAKRMGFYRAMAVRNLLIEMKMPKENIEVSVVEGQKNANASHVKVRSR